MKNKSLLTWIVIGVGLILFWWFVFGTGLQVIQQAFGSAPEPYKTICHHNPSQNVTLSFQNEQSYSGHLGTPHNDEVYDTDGACVEVTPSPTPKICNHEPSVTPSEEPTATPTPTIEVKQDTSGGSDGHTESLGCQHPSDNCNTQVVIPKAPPHAGARLY